MTSTMKTIHLGTHRFFFFFFKWTTNSLNELQHEVRDELGCGDNE